jgi:hypothetical protein
MATDVGNAVASRCGRACAWTNAVPSRTMGGGCEERQRSGVSTARHLGMRLRHHYDGAVIMVVPHHVRAMVFRYFGRKLSPI